MSTESHQVSDVYLMQYLKHPDTGEELQLKIKSLRLQRRSLLKNGLPFTDKAPHLSSQSSLKLLGHDRLTVELLMIPSQYIHNTVFQQTALKQRKMLSCSDHRLNLFEIKSSRRKHVSWDWCSTLTLRTKKATVRSIGKTSLRRQRDCARTSCNWPEREGTRRATGKSLNETDSATKFYTKV